MSEGYGALRLWSTVLIFVGVLGVIFVVAEYDREQRRGMPAERLSEGQAISRRIGELERDLAGLAGHSPLREPLERALSGRRGELASYEEVLEGIGMIEAQLEDAECLLSNLRGELLALDSRLPGGSLEPALAQLRSRVAYFRQSLDEVSSSVKTLPSAAPEGLPAG